MQSLSLSGPQVTDAGLKELAVLKNLTALRLSARVTDAGLKELAVLKNLTALDLNGTAVTDAGLKELAGLKSLQSLDLGLCGVADGPVSALGARGAAIFIFRSMWTRSPGRIRNLRPGN